MSIYTLQGQQLENTASSLNSIGKASHGGREMTLTRDKESEEIRNVRHFVRISGAWTFNRAVQVRCDTIPPKEGHLISGFVGSHDLETPHHAAYQ